MAIKYALQQVGVSDGTKVPPDKGDARQVNARKSSILASKQAGVDVWANGDTIVLGKKPAGQKISKITLTTGASLTTSTVSIGVAGTTAKYVNAATHTAPLNAPTAIGPLASTLDDAPGDEEDLIATIGVADIVIGTALTIEIEMVGI